MTNQFIKGLRDDRGEAPCRTFERWAEMAYLALAKPLASAAEADALEVRHQRLADAVGPARVQVSSELLALVVDELTATGGRDFLGAVALRS